MIDGRMVKAALVAGWMAISACGPAVDGAAGPGENEAPGSQGGAAVAHVPVAGATAATTGAVDRGVVWSVVEAGGGTVGATGGYAAPATPGQYHVRATSRADATAMATAVVTVSGGAAPAATLQVQGSSLLDTCGNRLVVRGVEQIVGYGMEVQGSWNGLVDQIALTGANAMRLLPNMSQLSTAQIESVIARAVQHQMVVYLSVGGANRSWFGQADVKTMLARYAKWLVLDALEEVSYDNRTQWRADALAAVAWFRGQGYTEPITVIANNYGRDLGAVLADGGAVAASDPLGRTILGWQAYWGSNNYWQGVYGMTLAQGIQRAAQQGFPVQLGILKYTDWYIFGATVTMDHVGAMSLAQQLGVGWLWWDYYNPFSNENSLSPQDGTVANLNTSFGRAVVATDPNSIGATSKKACGL